jgi:hypothetical protein
MSKKVFMLFVLFISLFVALSAQKTIIDDWANVKAPAAPQLTEVKVDPLTTALLILDIQKGLCNAQDRVRCFESVPLIKKLLTEARAKKMLVVYSLTSTGKPEDIVDEVAPLPGDPIVKSSVDKFIKLILKRY